jgi:hypothetical protein
MATRMGVGSSGRWSCPWPRYRAVARSSPHARASCTRTSEEPLARARPVALPLVIEGTVLPRKAVPARTPADLYRRRRARRTAPFPRPGRRRGVDLEDLTLASPTQPPAGGTVRPRGGAAERSGMPRQHAPTPNGAPGRHHEARRVAPGYTRRDARISPAAGPDGTGGVSPADGRVLPGAPVGDPVLLFLPMDIQPRTSTRSGSVWLQRPVGVQYTRFFITGACAATSASRSGTGATRPSRPSSASRHARSWA